MKKEYLKPEADITEWNEEDVLRTSGTSVDSDELNNDIYWTPNY